jgi:TPR repeat protein
MKSAKFTSIFLLFSILYFPVFGYKGNANIMSEDLQDMMKKAEEGDAYYQAVLGVLYRTGERVDAISLSEAEKWTTKAAEQKHPIGLANLGIIAMQSNYPAIANKHFDRAIDAKLKDLASVGDPIANYCMAEMFSSANPKDYSSASRYYGRAMNEGHQTSKGLLGSMNLFGIGIDVNRAKGLRLLEDASVKGSPIAGFSLGIAYVRGIGVEKNDETAIKWMQMSADKGYAQAQFYMGMAYQRGEGVSVDYEKSLYYLREASAQNFPEAEKVLTKAMEMPESQEILDRIVAQKKEQMKEKLASIDSENVQVSSPVTQREVEKIQQVVVSVPEVETKEASPTVSDIVNGPVLSFVESLKQKAEHGDVEAMKSLARRYSIMEQNYEESARWYEKAAIQGDAAAQRFLGVLFMMGKGVPRDFDVAQKWLEKAISNGDSEAKKKLKLLEEIR